MSPSQWFDASSRDFHGAVRHVRRAPMTTLVAVVTLGAGLGLNVGVFAVANAVFFKGFRLVDKNDRIL